MKIISLIILLLEFSTFGSVETKGGLSVISNYFGVRRVDDPGEKDANGIGRARRVS